MKISTKAKRIIDFVATTVTALNFMLLGSVLAIGIWQTDNDVEAKVTVTLLVGVLSIVSSFCLIETGIFENLGTEVSTRMDFYQLMRAVSGFMFVLSLIGGISAIGNTSIPACNALYVISLPCIIVSGLIWMTYSFMATEENPTETHYERRVLD